MKLFESNEKAINFYNKITNSQDGKNFISHIANIGIPNNLFEWAIKCIINEGVAEYILKYTYNMWKKLFGANMYIVPKNYAL